MATGGSYTIDKKTEKAVLKSRTKDHHAEGKKPPVQPKATGGNAK